jgi:predicted ArsR family transcriptional regulator
VATQFRHACNTELAFLQAALPDAEVERVAHQVVTGHVCAYQVSPRA